MSGKGGSLGLASTTEASSETCKPYKHNNKINQQKEARDHPFCGLCKEPDPRGSHTAKYTTDTIRQAAYMLVLDCIGLYWLVLA